ncbi:hypothetical protein A8709_10195 [Paenibacillus pectinilyticus]|uniref:Pycsar effector protein domain-containing protein n=1 Tax=Paenibacillus pectinilyticus TaxID=512399 RepID=A0A1C1A656_9BACL|nr:Pycsar system effector family protein [Paenibacillus pectinilyticus]OCT15981.1 hypothetical protein A8709_10195 [Paenibacillus pectinilyticus]
MNTTATGVADMIKKYSFALDTFKNIQELIRFVDQKSSAVLVIYGFILSAFIATTNKLDFINPFSLTFTKGMISLLAFVVGLSTLALLLYKIYIIINKILRPRLANNYLPNKHSIFYFEHIYKMGKDSYLEEFQNMNEDDFEKEVAAQVFEVSGIMVKKTAYLNKVMTHLFYSIALLLCFIFLMQFLSTIGGPRWV